MTYVRSLPLAGKRFRPNAAKTTRSGRVNRALLVAAAILICFLLADAALIAIAGPQVADLESLYISST